MHQQKQDTVDVFVVGGGHEKNEGCRSCTQYYTVLSTTVKSDKQQDFRNIGPDRLLLKP